MKLENLYWVENDAAKKISKARLKQQGILGNVLSHPNVYQGVPVYVGTSTNYTRKSLITEYDSQLDQVTEAVTYYPMPDVQVQQSIKNTINSLRDSKRVGGFETTLSTTQVVRIDTHDRAEQNVNGMVTNIALGSVTEDISWTDYDNTDLTLTIAEFIEMYGLAALHFKSVHENGKVRKTYIETLTYDDLVNFDINADIIINTITYAWPISIEETEAIL